MRAWPGLLHERGTCEGFIGDTGHNSLTMRVRYAHLSQEHKRKVVNLLNGLTAPEKGNCHIRQCAGDSHQGSY